MKANAIKRYKSVCEMCENPRGANALARDIVKARAIKLKAQIEEKFRTSKKYRNDPEIQALIGNVPEVKEEPKEEVKEEPKKESKKSGKKSKRRE